MAPAQTSGSKVHQDEDLPRSSLDGSEDSVMIYSWVKYIIFLLNLFFVFLCVAETIYLFIQALFPSKDWWVVPAKVVVDQTVWAAIWNSIYYVALGFLRRESPANIYGEVKSTFWPMLTVRNSLTLPLLAFSPLIPLDNILLTILVL